MTSIFIVAVGRNNKSSSIQVALMQGNHVNVRVSSTTELFSRDSCKLNGKTINTRSRAMFSKLTSATESV